MRTTLTISIDTSNMNKIYNDEDPEKFTPENEITEAMEEQIHQAIIHVIKSNLCEDTLQEALLNNCIPDFEFMGVDNWDSLEDYGTIKVTIENEGTQEREILSNFVNPNPIVEPDTISKKSKQQIKNAIKEEENKWEIVVDENMSEEIEEEESDNEDNKIY